MPFQFYARAMGTSRSPSTAALPQVSGWLLFRTKPALHEINRGLRNRHILADAMGAFIDQHPHLAMIRTAVWSVEPCSQDLPVEDCQQDCSAGRQQQRYQHEASGNLSPRIEQLSIPASKRVGDWSRGQRWPRIPSGVFIQPGRHQQQIGSGQQPS